MEPILVDTTIWIDWFSGINSAQTSRIANYLVDNHPIWVPPVVIQETLQGIRDDNQYDLVRSSLLALNLFHFDAFSMAIGAADLYRDLRKKGVTIQKANDCLIAHYALLTDMTLLHNDPDFDLIARHGLLKVSRL